MYFFEENLFNKESNKLWNKFKRNKHGIKITYIYLTVLQYEKTGDFDKWFKSSAREISYRSNLCISQVKAHLKSLILIKLAERKIKRTKKKEEGYIDYDSESFYRVKPLNDENFIKAIDSFDYIGIAKEVKQYDKKERSKL